MLKNEILEQAIKKRSTIDPDEFFEKVRSGTSVLFPGGLAREARVTRGAK